MPDQTMIERVASAVEAELQRQNEQVCLGLFVPREDTADWITVDGNIVMTPLVRAVLIAMREPTRAMLKAKAQDDDGNEADVGGYLDYLSADKIWPAMIDAALEDNP